MKAWVNNTVLGRILIIVGTLAVLHALFPIYLYENSRNWPSTQGTVTVSKMLGVVMHLKQAITFNYKADAKEFTSMQVIPRDAWVEECKEGSQIPLHYKSDEPKLVIIDHPQMWQNMLLASWNALWIVAGLILLKRK